MIRFEHASDVAAIRAIHTAAFSTKLESKIVDRLRDNKRLAISLVEIGGDLPHEEIVGHIAFSPVALDGENLRGVGLAPVAVLPEFQRQGIGGRLIRAGLVECKKAGFDFVVVLGDPVYYKWFGFKQASTWRLENEYGVDEEFMAIELKPNCLNEHGGMIRYGQEFADG